jgi:hypothetical protein
MEGFNMSMYSDSFSIKTLSYAARLFISSVFIIPISHWPETGKKMEFVNSWTELQVRYTLKRGKE